VSNTRKFDYISTYRIIIYGNLDRKWSDWFDGFSINSQPGDQTELIGPVNDQSALHGVLNKIFDLGLPLLEVERIEVNTAESNGK
jgi:hypothetical protein